MKATKYLVAGALMLSLAAPTMAQDVKAQVDAITKVVIDANGDAVATKQQIKEFIKQNKKDAVAIAGLGRAFFTAKNYETAKLYADQAIKVNKNCGAGYILHGDIASAEENGGEAANWYQMSTTYDPSNDIAYVKYARVYQKVDPKGAVEMLEKLRAVKPDYPVEAAAGYMFSSNNQLKTAMQWYDQVKDVTTLDDYILFDYASTSYVLEQYDKALKLTAAGLQKYPKYTSFNRIGLYASDKQKAYADAVTYGNNLFNTTDTIKYTVNDYIYYGDALENVGRVDDAVAAYKHIAEIDANNHDGFKYIATANLKAKRFNEAVDAYRQYIAAVGDQASYKDLDAIADVYIDEATQEGITDEAKVAAFENADKVYGEMAEKFENTKYYAAWKRALMNHQINPDVKVGRALPFYKNYIELVEPKADKTETEVGRLATSYTYLAIHYIQNDKKAEAKHWAAKLLEIRPDDPNGKQIMELK